ncbi:MAG: DUF2523 domain-containing protein [Proteobacteria bacterium]|nr:DUF2523 domain-containing protein [Pseudomonadota bacterium]
MPWIASVILGGLLELMGSLVGRALLALGFGFAEYAGVSLLFDQVKAYASSALGGFGSSDLVAWAGFFRIDQHITIIISAIGVKMIFNGLTGSRVRKLVQK